MYFYGYFQTGVLINFFMPLRGETHRFSYAKRHNGARRWGVIANDILKVGKLIEFQSLCAVIYYKIHFRVVLHQPICVGEVSVAIVIGK